MKPLVLGVSVPPKWTTWAADMYKRTGLSFEELREIYETEHLEGETWLNELYVVIKKSIGKGGIHLSIRRQDRAACRDWRHFQKIKNQLAGPEREALELYPAESRLVDGANQFHIWVLPEGVQVPVGWKCRYVSEEGGMGAVQRPLEEE